MSQPMLPKNLGKTASQPAIKLCKVLELVPFCDCNSEVREDDPTCDYCHIAKALESYLLQESGELVKCLELYQNQVENAPASKPGYYAKQALNTFRSRHDG